MFNLELQISQNIFKQGNRSLEIAHWDFWLKLRKNVFNFQTLRVCPNPLVSALCIHYTNPIQNTRHASNQIFHTSMQNLQYCLLIIGKPEFLSQWNFILISRIKRNFEIPNFKNVNVVCESISLSPCWNFISKTVHVHG